jgi:VWFA-related protein
VSKTFLRTIVVGLLAVVASAQQPYSETVEVRVVNLDVMVTDRAGNPVSALTRDDFLVFENGKPQPITNFYEVRGSRRTAPLFTAGGAPEQEEVADPRPRKIIIFFDNESMSPPARNQVLKHIKKFVADARRDHDEVMIASAFTGLKIDLQFTSDATAIMEAIDRVAGAPGGGHILAQQLRDVERKLRDLPEEFAIQSVHVGGNVIKSRPPYTMGFEHVTNYANHVLHRVNQTANAMNALAASLAGIEGRKVMVYATESLPPYPGREAFEYFEGLKDKYDGGAGHSPVSEGMLRFDATGMITSIGDAANAAGVSLYPVSVRGTTHMVRTADETGEDEYDSQKGFTSALAARALNPTTALRGLAAVTGGVAFTDSSNFEKAMDRIATDMDWYYSLGYRPSRAAGEQAKSVEVRLKDGSGRVVRHRSGLVDRTPEGSQQQELAASISHDAQKNDLGISLKPLPLVTGEDGKSTLPMRVVIPMDALTLLPDGEDLAGKLSIIVQFVRNDNVMSMVSRRTSDFRFPASSRSRRKELTMQTDIALEPDVRRISVGVIDENSQVVGYAVYDVPGR